MNEYEIIEKFFKRQTPDAVGVILGIGDDAAIVRVPADRELVLAIDTLVAGVHFPRETAPEDIGWKALAVNLGDLAAMGAEPHWVTLSLSLPEADEDWLSRFAQGFFQLAGRYGLALIGGDLCRGPLAVTVQAHGLVPAGQAITRAGARPGDRIYVSGTLGDAGYSLTEAGCHGPYRRYFRGRLDRPEPRLKLGQALRGIATSAIDISDGLAGDLAHILNASHVGAELDATRLPLSRELQMATEYEEGRRLALTAGDDYELCFTAAPASDAAIEQLAAENRVRLTVVGTIQSGSGLKCLEISRDEQYTGYRHF